MGWFRVRNLDLQAKIILVLLAVILPTFVVVTLIENQFTRPLLEKELRQVGINAAKALGAEILSDKSLSRPDAVKQIENRISELVYSQPNILRVDVFAKDPATGIFRFHASSVLDDPTIPHPTVVLVDRTTAEFRTEEDNPSYYDISVPIEQRSRSSGSVKIVGMVNLLISTQLVTAILAPLWRIKVTAAIFSVLTLMLVLSFFLRRTILNERLLRRAETQNVVLSEQLHEAHRQLMNTEKLAVMGQLTASFAHEIGTPLNAIGGHLQLLREDLHEASTVKSKWPERMDIISGQLLKIEGIVKGFLQNTAKPPSQHQLVDVNQVIQKTLSIVKPRADSLGVDLNSDLERRMGPLRVAPLDLEQILLNLVNNSLDSLREKKETHPANALELGLSSRLRKVRGDEWAEIEVYDTGVGVRKDDIGNVFKPFFTTKRYGEGTGLGLTICRQLANKYGGTLELESREGSWTRLTLLMPYAPTE